MTLVGGDVRTLAYDPRGNLISESWGKRRGQTVETAWDDLDRPLRRAGGDFYFDRLVTWAWDEDGSPRSASATTRVPETRSGIRRRSRSAVPGAATTARGASSAVALSPRPSHARTR